ncbi:MAG: STAS domain-containing protein [Bacillota bacterium]
MNKLLSDKTLVLQPVTELTADRVRDLVEKAKQFIDDKDDFFEVVLDIRNVKIIDSTGISFVVGLYKSVKKLEKGFRIEGVCTDIQKLFNVMKLDEVFKINTL